MDSAYFFVAGPTASMPLRDVAERVFNLLGVQDWEERFSSNYPPDEHYFVGYAENGEVTVYDSDDDAKPDYQFRVSILYAASKRGRGILETAPSAIAPLLASGSLRVFVPHDDWARIDWNGAGVAYPD